MADFTELNVDGSGEASEVCGPYHMNRHRIYFEKPKTHFPYVSTLLFDFSRFLNQGAAKVESRSREFQGLPTFAFTGAPPVPILDKITASNPHEDWVYVAQSDIRRGFTGQTLKRNYLEKKEIAAIASAAPVAAAEDVFDKAKEYFGSEKDRNSVKDAVRFAIKVNQHHFLAGRRSWIIAPAEEFDHGPGRIPNNVCDLMVFETAAIERASMEIYNLARKLFDEQTKIIWSTLLRQYVSKNGFKVVDHTPWMPSESIIHSKNVTYMYGQTNSKIDMECNTLGMCKIHKHLWP
ncbi:hypothetical protein N9M10_02680 [Hellea sp.]|nr:hypothetical protein [Hellea sp.]